MTQPITMPALSDTMSNGRLVKWTKKSGDKVKKGDVIAEVETDKAVMDVEAFQDGYLSGPLAAEGMEAPVGQTIGYIADNLNEVASAKSTAVPAATAAAAPQPNAADRNTPAKLPAEAPPISPVAPASPVSPVLAASMAAMRPSPVRSAPPASGVLQTAAVPLAARASPERAALPAASPALSALQAGPPYRLERASSVREAVARNMIDSLATPTFRVTAELALAALKKAADDTRTSFTVLLARACAVTITAHPLFNAIYTPDGLAMRERVDVGIAVDTPDGLIAAVLRDVAKRPLAALSEDWRSLRDKVSSRRLMPEDYKGATFYLSNLGTFPVVHSFDAVLPLGAAAILCVAAADGDRTSLTLGCDHRVVSGADAARFLQTLSERVAAPAKLADKLQ
ncbi:MAG: 2-oxo acid dehydrogenase subunit E2 [Xanthobacteraceae bacterium]